MPFTDEQLAKLKSKLDSANVSQHPYTGKDYVEGWHVIQEANEIFGFDGWSSELLSLECTVKEQRSNGAWDVAYLSTVRVTAADKVHEDTGTGTGTGENRKTLSAAIESAAKEAVTDGLKRCLRHWGNRFGLALYDKKQEGVERNPASKPPVAPISNAKPQSNTQATETAVNEYMEGEQAPVFLNVGEFMTRALKQLGMHGPEVFKVLGVTATDHIKFDDPAQWHKVVVFAKTEKAGE